MIVLLSGSSTVAAAKSLEVSPAIFKDSALARSVSMRLTQSPDPPHRRCPEGNGSKKRTCKRQTNSKDWNGSNTAVECLLARSRDWRSKMVQGLLCSTYHDIWVTGTNLLHGEGSSLSRVDPYQFCSGGTLDKPSSAYHFRVGPWKVLQPHWLKSQASELSRGRAKRQIGPLSSASMMKIPELTPRTAKLSSPGMKQPSSPMHGSRWYHNISKLQQNITRWSRMWA